MSSSPCAEGFLLLTLPNCTLTTPSIGAETGHLSLQCVTLDSASEDQTDRDVWLVLKLNSFEMIISSTQRINYSRSMHTYMFLPEVESSEIVQLFVPPDPSNPASSQDLETMEVVLSQYGVLYDFESTRPEIQKGGYSEKCSTIEDVNGPGLPTGTVDFKGRLVLMDENDGGIVGTLDDAVPITEDKYLTAKSHEKDPVVINLPGEAEVRQGRIRAYAHPASPEEQDMLMQTAGLISRGIILATSAIATGLNSASNYYISHSTPSPKPVEFSPYMRTNLRRIQTISGTAVAVTSKTTGAILKTLDYVADRVTGSGLPSNRHSTGSQLAPPLPPGASSSVHSLPWTSPGEAPPLPQRKLRLLNDVLASTNLLLTTLEQSARELIETGTNAVSASLGHKYGQDMSDASNIAGQSVQNVGLVYIDARGVGRRALLKRAGKAVVTARMGERDILLGPRGQDMQSGGVNVDSGQHTFPPLSGAQSTSPPEYSEVMKGGASSYNKC